MNNSAVFDDVFFSVLKECKTLPTFLDAVFGFLRRRTDFYVIATEPKAPVGLPPGWAENFVKQAFFKWKPKDQNEPDIVPDHLVPPAVVETEVVTSECDEIIEPLNSCAIEEKPSSSTPTQPKTATNVIPEFIPSESYNGASYDNYSWSQNINEVDVVVKLPENLTTKNLLVDIGPQKIHIAHKNSNEVLLSGDLCHKIKHNDVLWALENKKLQIHLDKVQEIWWDCLLQSEPRLDMTKLDCSRPYEDLSEDAQAKIEQLAWDQERKRQGLPTSEEVTMHETLKKAWNAEGSPFSGPFDPSKVQIN